MVATILRETEPDRERFRGLAFLERIVHAAVDSTDVNAAMDRIVRDTSDATRTQVCSVFIWDDAAQCLILAATTGLGPEAVGRARVRLGEGVTGWVGQNQVPLAVPDVTREPRFLWLPGVDQERFISMLSVPMMVGNRLVGVLNVQTDNTHDYAPEETDFLRAIADHLAGIIEICGLQRELVLANALRASEERYRCIVETAQEGMLTFNPQGAIVYANRRAREMLGCSLTDLLGRGVFSWSQAVDEIRRLANRPYDVVLSQYDLHIPCTDGSERWVIVSANPIADEDGSLVETLVMLTDITERKRAEEALRHQALHDPLTGLPNRALLEERLEHALQVADRTREPVSVLLFDLDRFKEVNDSIGHSAGDVLLREIGPRLAHLLRESDTVARLGGDEFVVVLPSVGAQDGAVVADKILTELEQPFHIEGHDIYVGASVGLVTYPAHGSDVATLLRRSDIAMYEAKRDRGTFVMYMDGQDSGNERLILAAALQQSLRTTGLELYYQPKLDMATRRISGVEALMRWHHPEYGLMMPGVFIPVAEQSGLITALGRWSLATAVEQSREWKQAGVDLTMAVNLSMRNLRDPKLPDRLFDLLEQANVEPWRLKLEVTESMLMAEPERTVEILGRLRAIGLQISIDDFGTGYSSLSHLARMPVSEIKIDKSFVLDSLTNQANAVIVRATIDLAHNLGLTVVAEGVETQGVWDQLALWGCDQAQGYLIARPMPEPNLLQWIHQEPYLAA